MEPILFLLVTFCLLWFVTIPLLIMHCLINLRIKVVFVSWLSYSRSSVWFWAPWREGQCVLLVFLFHDGKPSITGRVVVWLVISGDWLIMAFLLNQREGDISLGVNEQSDHRQFLQGVVDMSPKPAWKINGFMLFEPQVTLFKFLSWYDALCWVLEHTQLCDLSILTYGILSLPSWRPPAGAAPTDIMLYMSAKPGFGKTSPMARKRVMLKKEKQYSHLLGWKPSFQCRVS